MSKYKIMRPCVVRTADGKSAVDYRKVGEVVTVADKTDADLLVKGGFLEAVSEPKNASPPPPPEKPRV